MSKTVLSKVAGKVPANPASALEAFNMLVKAHHDYKVTAETERTKRSAIEAWRQVQVGNLFDEVGRFQSAFEQFLQQHFFPGLGLVAGGEFGAVHLGFNAGSCTQQSACGDDQSNTVHVFVSVWAGLQAVYKGVANILKNCVTVK